ncbi:D-alanyl-D-alanine carboxypeptidase family protein [Cellulomonas aerilata]|uniref:D-alanyl-D-alanine carboxypeptidase family protein n=1 Tax=Cellulomonas aerilata TaxID=515326 RepID=UPI0031DD6596
MPASPLPATPLPASPLPATPLPASPRGQHPGRVLAQVARRGVVVVAAGVLVAGDLGGAGTAPSAVSSVASAASQRSERSTLRLEAQRLAASERTEALALARAALDAAAAADALSRAARDAALEVSAAADGAVAHAGTAPGLSPEQLATLEAIRLDEDAAALPGPLERLRPVRSRAAVDAREAAIDRADRSATARTSASSATQDDATEAGAGTAGDGGTAASGGPDVAPLADAAPLTDDAPLSDPHAGPGLPTAPDATPQDPAVPDATPQDPAVPDPAPAVPDAPTPGPAVPNPAPQAPAAPDAPLLGPAAPDPALQAPAAPDPAAQAPDAPDATAEDTVAPGTTVDDAPAWDEAAEDGADDGSVADDPWMQPLDGMVDPEAAPADDDALGHDDALAPEDVPTDEARALAAAVARLAALVAAASPESRADDVLRVGSDDAPDAGAGAGAATLDRPTLDEPSEVTVTGAALTAALRETAGTVFALSLRVEALTQTAVRADVATGDEVLADVDRTAAAVVEAAGQLVELEPLTAAERADRTATAARAAAAQRGALAARARVPARLSPLAPSAVADLATRWDNGQIPVSAMCEVEFAPNHRLQCDAAEALADLNDAYREDFGTDLRLTDSYRTFEAQVAVKQAKGFLAATPGTSNHGWGLAIDVVGAGALGRFDSPVYLWLDENAEDFGWHHPRGMEPGGSGPQEPWHWEYATE